MAKKATKKAQPASAAAAPKGAAALAAPADAAANAVSASPETATPPGSITGDAPIGAPLSDPHWPQVDGVTAQPEAAPAAKAKAKRPAPDDEDGFLVVIGPKGGRWRAGRFFTPSPTRIPLADLSVEDEKKIEDDPLLSTTIEERTDDE